MVLIQFNKRLDLLLQNPSLLLPDFFSLPKILYMLILHPSHLLIHLKLINLKLSLILSCNRQQVLHLLNLIINDSNFILQLIQLILLLFQQYIIKEVVHVVGFQAHVPAKKVKGFIL